MLITRTPLRISIGGGGTDLPAYYQKHGGYFISAAINRYIYIALHKTFQKNFIVKYSRNEVTQSIDEIKHPMVREAYRLHEMSPYLEMSSMADIPAGTGLGSSGAFGVGLLKAIHSYKREHVLPGELARQACHIEMDVLKEPVGKQDQYIASYGGITRFIVDRNGEVEARRLALSNDTIHDLEDNLLMFFTGFDRCASKVLKEQEQGLKEDQSRFVDNLHFINEIGREIERVLLNGDCARFGDLLHAHWEYKIKQSESISNPHVNDLYDLGKKNGAIGGKLIGAGGGGFLLFYAENKQKLRAAMRKAELEEVRFGFDFEGAKVLV